MPFLERKISDFVRWSIKYPKFVLLLGALLTLISLLAIQRLQIRTNFSDLLPEDNPVVQQAKTLEKTVGGASFIVVAVETQSPEAAVRFLGDLKTRLAAHPDFQLRYIDDETPIDFFRKSSLLFLSLDDLDDLHNRIERRIEQEKLKKTRLYIDFESSGDALENEIQDLQGKYAAYLSPNKHYQNKAGTLFASFIKPDWRSTDVAKTQEFLGKIQGVIAELNPHSYDASLNVRLTGPYIKQLTQKQILLDDAKFVSVLSFVGSILYLIFHFRRKRAVTLIGIPLTISSFWSLGMAYALFGSLNLFSSACCAILLGLAADYGIHFYSEYRRHRILGEPTEKALIESIGHLGGAFIAASSTTSAAFFSLGLTRFKALHEMGIISGVGIILCAASFILLFAPLVILTERRWPEKITVKEGPKEWSADDQHFSRGWMRWLFSKKNLVLTSFLLLAPLLMLLKGRPYFDYNLNHILGQQETKDLDRKIDGIFNHTVNPEVGLASDFDDAKKAAAALRAVQKKNEASPQGTTIKGVLSLGDFVPDHQEEKMRKIEEIRKLFTPQIKRVLNAEEQKSYDEMMPMLSPKKITYEDVPEQIRQKFMDREGSVGRLVFIFPNFDTTRTDRFMRFVEEIRGTQCTDCKGPFFSSGESTVFYEIVDLLFRESRYVVLFTVGMIILALWFNFKSLKLTFLVMSPLLIGLAATVGWMGLLNIPFNIINLAAIPIILGTADDYGVHLFQRVMDNRSDSLRKSYSVSFRPILGAAITTLVGFGSLGFADMGGIRSFGLLCFVGILICTITTLVWFPPFLQWVTKAKK